MKKLLAGLVALLAVIMAVPVLAIPMFASIITTTQSTTTNTACTSGDGSAVTVNYNVTTMPEGLTGVSLAQLNVAAIIMQAGADAGVGARGQLIGIMTAMQESDLGADLTNLVPNSDGDAGVFQQRTYSGWYGSLAMVIDPRYAADAFFNGVTATQKGGWGSVGGGTGYGHLPGLKDISGWESMPPTIAASEVQKPDEDYRNEYAKHEEKATEIMTALSGMNLDEASSASISDCTGTVTSTATGTVKAVIDYAKSWEGKGLTYHMGGGNLDGPTSNTFDCSSFVGAAWKQGAGVEFGRSAQDQWNNLAAYRVSVDELQPGDLLFEAAGRRGPVGSPDGVSHVAMYLGDGQLIEWGHSRNGFNIGPIAGRVDAAAYVGAARPPAPSTDTTGDAQ